MTFAERHNGLICQIGHPDKTNTTKFGQHRELENGEVSEILTACEIEIPKSRARTGETSNPLVSDTKSYT